MRSATRSDGSSRPTPAQIAPLLFGTWPRGKSIYCRNFLLIEFCVNEINWRFLCKHSCPDLLQHAFRGYYQRGDHAWLEIHCLAKRRVPSSAVYLGVDHRQRVAHLHGRDRSEIRTSGERALQSGEHWSARHKQQCSGTVLWVESRERLCLLCARSEWPSKDMQVNKLNVV